MKKRVLLIFLIIALVVVPLFAENNGQKIRSLDDDTYEAISYLYVKKGLAQPSLTAPYSDNELLLMLKKIENMNFNSTEEKILNYIKGNLNEKLDYEGEGISYNWDFNFAIESFIHNNTTDFQTKDNWNYDKIYHKPLIDINFETYAGDNFYGFGDFSVGLVENLANVFGSSILTTNVLMVPPSILTDLDFNMPYRAFVAAGGDYWSFELGRDRLSWGGGETGNLTVSDNLLYHNLARATAFGDKYKYTFVTSFFPHPSMYIHEDGGGYDYDPLTGLSQTGLQDGINMYMAHRLEWRLFKDKMNITLTESIMYQSLTGTLDLRVISPAAIFHDYYIRGNANSILGLEFDITPINCLNIYGQAIVDEFPLPGETSSSTIPPTAMGFLVGAKANMDIAGLAGKASFEFAKTDPFLYLRDNGDYTQEAEEYGINYVVTIREFTNDSGTIYNPEFLGYNYGGDAIVLNANAGVKEFGKWSFEANLFFMKHGTFDYYTCWDELSSSNPPTTPTSSHDVVENSGDSDVSDRNAVSTTFIGGVHGSYQITKSFKAYGQFDYINIVNYENILGQKTSDVQITLGLSYTL